MEPYWPGLFAKALEGINVKDLITNIDSSVRGGPAPGGGNSWSGFCLYGARVKWWFFFCYTVKSFVIF